MSVDVDALKDAILSTLKDHLSGFKDDLKQDWEVDMEQIATDIANQSLVAASSGNEDAIRNVVHLKAQAELIGAKIAIREQNRVIETIEKVAIVSLQILGRALIKILA